MAGDDGAVLVSDKNSSCVATGSGPDHLLDICHIGFSTEIPQIPEI